MSDIYDLSQECRSAFASILHVPDARSLPVVEVLRDEFEQWTSYLGVFACQSVCLDTRLMYSDSLRNLVLQLLQISMRNLDRIVKIENQKKYHLSDTSQSSVVAEMESEDTAEISSPLIESLKALEAAVHGLHRLGWAIRHSSATNLTQRITSFNEKIDSGSIESLFFIRLKEKLIDIPRLEGKPGASITLCKQLAVSIAFRYFRIRYRHSHHLKLKATRQREPTSEAIDEPVGKSIDMSAQKFNLASRKPLQIRANQLISDIPVTEPTIPDSSKPLEGYESSSLRSTGATPIVSVQLQDATYPDIPQATVTCCPYCAQTLPASAKKEKRAWEEHVDDDLEPYTCISEECVDPPQLFSRYNAWARHMEDKHSSRWTEEVHKPISWCCDTDHEEQYFDDEGDFDEHVKADHQDYRTKDKIAGLKEWSEVRRARPPYTCPICGCVPEDMATVTPWSIQGSSSMHISAPHQINSDSEVKLRCCLFRHIGSHVKSLGLMSIVYLGHEEDEPQTRPLAPDGRDEDEIVNVRDSEPEDIHSDNQESLNRPKSSRFFGSTEWQYEDIFDNIRSQLKDDLEKKNTTERFATRGMVMCVLSPSKLEAVYEALKAANAKMPMDTDQVNARKFTEKVKERKLQHFLAVLIYAKCSIDATKEFVDKLVFGNEAEFQEEEQETPNLLPASKKFLERLFSRPSDRRDFFDEQRTFCTLVLGGRDLVTISSDDQISLPWLEQEQIGTGAFGVVYKVKIPKGHLTMDGNFSQSNSRLMTVARKDFICVDTAEANFKKAVKAIRDIFSGQATHKNILKSFGTIVIEGKPSTFSLLMPWADLDLQEYMKRNPEIPPGDTSTRESIIRSARELAGALDFLHRKMTTSEGDPLVCYHMGLKPSNILIFHDTRRRPEAPIRDMIWKISDFDLLRVKTRTRSQADLSNLFRTRLQSQSSQASATQNFRGTDIFLPVEAELEGRTMNEKSDIWSFGCILSLLFTYMVEGYKGFRGYSESRLLYSNKNVDYFYQYNKSNIEFQINRGVVEQHEKLIKSAVECSPSEGGAVRYMLKSLLSEVLLIDQSSRCGADRIVELLHTTLKKYSTVEREFRTVESEFGITKNDSMPHSLVRKAQEKVLGLFRRESKQSLAQTNIRRWRLEVDKELKYNDCVCSPDGSRVAYWTGKTITLFDGRSGLANAIPYRRVDSMGSRMSSTDSERESTLTVAGQYSLADWSRSWRSVKLTNTYLIAATTDDMFTCYIFDVEFDRKLNMYSRVTLSHPGIHMLAVSPDRNSLACILQDKRGHHLLFTGRIAFDPDPQLTPAARIYSDTARREYKDAGVCIVDQKATLLELPPGDITCLTLETRNQGYIIVRKGPTLSVNVFIIEPLEMKQQDLMQRSMNNNVERLFTDMACLQSDHQSQRSELIITSQAERLFHLRYEGFESSPTVVIHPPIQNYRILKIATVEHSRKILALGSQSGSNHLFLLNIETQSSDVRPKIKKLADIGVSAGYQAKLSVYCEGNETIARIMVDMLEGRYLVFQIDVSNSLGT